MIISACLLKKKKKKVNAHVCHKHRYNKPLTCDWSLQIEVGNSV